MHENTNKKLDLAETRRSGVDVLPSGTKSQLEYERFKATARLLPSLMLGNVFLASITYVSIDLPGFMLAKTFAYVAMCMLCLCSFAFWQWRRREVVAANVFAKMISLGEQRVFTVMAFLLGCIWAIIPPILPVIAEMEQLVMASAILAAIFCVAGFTLSSQPRYATAFLGPILATSFATLWISGTPQSLMMCFALALYVAFIMATAASHSQSLTRVVLAGSEVAKQQKTISLLLRDFEKHSSDWLWEIDSNSHFIRVFDRFAEVSGRSADDLSQLKPSDLFTDRKNHHPAVDVLLSSIDKRVSFTDMQVPITVNDEQHWWSLTGTPDFNEAGIYCGYHGVGSDITQQKKADERINFLAHNDALTGLFNRAHFTEILNQNVSRLERYGAPFSLIFMDLDHFKAVNDSFGHPAGDRLLTEVAARLRQEVPTGAHIARLGGDEFAILIPKSVSIPDLELLAKAILSSISAPYDFDGEKVKIGVSIGMAAAPRHGTRPDQLLRNVDLALYRAKEGGRNAYRVFESGMDSVARERRALEFDLRTALESGELELFYQPLMGSIDSMPVGFEALMRWNHPLRGRVSPAEFVPIAESTGLIKTIGEWAIHEACQQASTWPSHLTVAVNLSAPQFDRDRIVDVVASALAQTGLEPHRLELEITESLLIDRPDEVLATLMRLKDLGVSIAMDDFGTGYSSLSYLLKFPFDKIKIDKSFISAINTDKAACDVLRTIGALGKSLNVRITAEGVETEAQADFLRAIACDQLQGFFFAKPLQVHDIPAFLAGRTATKLREGNLAAVSKTAFAA